MKKMNFEFLDNLNPSTEEILMMEDSLEFCETIDAEEEITTEYVDEENVQNDTKEKNDEEFYMEDSMRMYLFEIGNIPLLSAEEEKELGKRIKAGGEDALQARNNLVQANLRLVIHYAKRFLGRGIELEDLNSMGIEGLIKAAEKYDYSLGYKFSTYASWWIKQAISRGIADEANTVRIPVHMSEIIHKVCKVQKILTLKNGENPRIQEIAEYSGLAENSVLAAIQSMYTIVSFDTKVGEDGDTTIEDFIADGNAEDPCVSAVNSGLKEAVQLVLSQLNPREALVLSLRNGIGVSQPMTLEQIAKLPAFGLTRERIRQIESKAIRKIIRNPKMRELLREYAA